MRIGLREPSFEACLTESSIITRNERSLAHLDTVIARVRVSDNLSRITGCGQSPPGELVETKLFWPADLDGAIDRRSRGDAALFLGCVRCHSGAEVFFLLNFLVAEGRWEVFEVRNLTDLDVGFALVRAALDPLDGLFERLDPPEPVAGDEFLGFGEGAVNDGAVPAGEVDAGAFGGGVKTVVAYQDSGLQEIVVEFVHVGHELGIGGCAFVFGSIFRAFDDHHESHSFVLSGGAVRTFELRAYLRLYPYVERQGTESTQRTTDV